MNRDDDPPQFQTVDWETTTRSRRYFTAQRLVALFGFAVICFLYLYNARIDDYYLVGKWHAERLDWVFLCSLVVVLAYGVVPLSKRWNAVLEVLGRLRSRPGSVLALGYLGVVAFLGLFGPVLNLSPSNNFRYNYNPPWGFSVERTQDGLQAYRQCAGTTTGGPFEEACHGSTTFLLGTNGQGSPVTELVMAGARPAVYVVVIGAVFVVPLATAVGVVAGLRGGLLDRLLMSYVDLQLSLPAILIYFVLFMATGPSLLVLLVAFGLLSWGGVARLVRSEVKQRRERGHVTVARSLGASESYIARRHIIPNITNTLVPAVCQLLALFVLYEAGVAFIGFYEVSLQSWGTTISRSISAEVGGQMQLRSDIPATRIWWVSTFPAIALTLTMAAFKLLGDGLRDALDPRGDY
jgi:peptide/nickel transport system permease protein